MKKHLLVVLAALVASLGTVAASHGLTLKEAPENLNELPVGGYELAVTTNSEYAARVLITTKKPLKDFNIVAIEYVPNDDPKDLTPPQFKKTKTLYTLPLFSPDRPIYALVEMMGSLPNIAIYTTEKDLRGLWALSQSGEDGSFFIHPVGIIEN